jgi:hypothetical protein
MSRAVLPAWLGVGCIDSLSGCRGLVFVDELPSSLVVSAPSLIFGHEVDRQASGGARPRSPPARVGGRELRPPRDFTDASICAAGS